MAGSTFDARRSGSILRGGFLGRLPAMLAVVVARAKQECPKRSGRLAASVEGEVVADPDRPRVRVGTNRLYGRWRCTGTRKMAPDDFLTRAAIGTADEVKRVAEGG